MNNREMYQNFRDLEREIGKNVAYKKPSKVTWDDKLAIGVAIFLMVYTCLRSIF